MHVRSPCDRSPIRRDTRSLPYIRHDGPGYVFVHPRKRKRRFLEVVGERVDTSYSVERRDGGVCVVVSCGTLGWSPGVRLAEVR